MMPKIEERLTICASRCRDKIGRKARVPCTVPQKLMLNSQSICACSISLNWPSKATPALLMTMLSLGCAAVAAAANSAICAGSPTSTRCVATLRAARLGDLGGDRLQPGLVAVGQRQVAAARGQFERQRAADAAGRAGHGGGRSIDRSHCEVSSGR